MYNAALVSLLTFGIYYVNTSMIYYLELIYGQAYIE